MSIAQLIANLLAGSGFLAGLAALIAAPAQRRKILAEANKPATDAAAELSNAALAILEPARKQVEYLQAELTTAREDLLKANREIHTLRRLTMELEDKVHRLTNQLEALGA